VWTVRNKVDLGSAAAAENQPENLAANLGQEAALKAIAISARRGDGVDDLVAALCGFAAEFFGSGEAGAITRQRHRDLLSDTAIMLRCSIAGGGRGEELIAEDLRSATRSLGRLLGQVDVEDVLEALFKNFCIGK
jgi:tRNA modification GTPase